MFGPAWHCLTQFDVQADSVLQMVLDLGRYLDNHPIPDHEDIVNIIKEIVGTIVTSVNGKTGDVTLKLSDVTGTDSWPVWILSNAEYGEITDATMLDAYDNDGFRLLYVQAGDDPEKEPAFLMIPGRTFNPDGITRYIFTGGGGSGGGAVQSVNGKVGTVVLTAADVGALPDTYTVPVTKVFDQTGEIGHDVNVRAGGDGASPTAVIERKANNNIELRLIASKSQLNLNTRNEDGTYTDNIIYPPAVSSVNGMTGNVALTAKDIGAYGPDNAPPYPVTSVNTKIGAVTLAASDVGAPNIAEFNSLATQVGTKYGPDNAPPYPVTGRTDETGTALFFANGSGSVGVAGDTSGNVYGINRSGEGLKMYSPLNPPPASAIPCYYARSNTALWVGNTDTAVPFQETVLSGAGISYSNATFTIPAGTYAISIFIGGALNTSDSTQVILKTVNTSTTLYYVQSYFSATPSNQFLLPWPMQLYQFASTTTFRVVAQIDAGGSIGAYNPYTISIIKLA